MKDRLEKHLQEIRNDLGRGGCGILAVAELSSRPSHDLLQTTILGLKRMEHRGGTLEDTGDGAGILLKPERRFFERFVLPGRKLDSPKEPIIVGTAFFLHGERNVPQIQRKIDLILRREGLMPLGWRKVPVNMPALGSRAREDAPIIYQLLAAKGHRREAQLFEALHQVKTIVEKEIPGIINIASLAPYTTVYKALGTADQLVDFYPDFNDSDFKTSVAVAHRRYSTNTFSNWNLVQPFRHIAHNGEINTITSNCRAIKDADSALKMSNTLMNYGSDSAQIDRVAEMMAANGMGGIHEALRRMITPAWTEDCENESERKFFEANRRALGTLGAWEGPIAIVGTDGHALVAILDRMGLRPLRYIKTASGRIIISSEMGAVPVDPEDITDDGQLEPGGMLAVDLDAGTFIPPPKSAEWTASRTGMDFTHLATVNLVSVGKGEHKPPLSIKTLNAFGWTREKISHLKETVLKAKEPIYGMGNDMPLAIFGKDRPRLYNYLHQIVAVVTNPPIDPLREGGAIDTTIYLGRSPQLTRRSDYKSWPQYELEHPVLTNEDMAALYASDEPELKIHKLDATFEHTGKSRAMIRRIHSITEEALEAVRSQRASILVLSDYEATKSERPPLPMLLTVSSIHRALAAAGLRRYASIVVETGEVHESHDCVILLAYGATAVNPYAMFDLAKEISGLPPEEATSNLVQAIVRTLKKVMSKMGITSIAGYRGSALFEAIGISSDVVEYLIPDTMSRLGGITMEDIYADTMERFSASSDDLVSNKNISVYRREVTDALQLVARSANDGGDYDRFVRLLEETPPIYLRDMLKFISADDPLPLDQVAGVDEIVRTTFSAAGMSHGALNATAHRAIAAGFNYFNSHSCSGEGGEDERRNPGNEWEIDRSRIRQIASGRFGVDAKYLVHADEIEIKIGQGAKPGEGGHLPGRKVTDEIARIRKTKAGIDLISPPPHHDIYSIEDLAQLIKNLKELNPRAKVSVKVPSITGLGTIGIGILKAGADVIVISGYSGGTGAASSSSIAHAGLPLERGVSEVHQFLLANDVRSGIRIRADGGIKSGLDVAKIMALGADEVAIGTPLLIAECCTFCRGCSKGNCPVGIATHDKKKQDERFMRRYVSGDPSGEVASIERYEEAKKGVIRYLTSLAQHLKNILSEIGLRHPSELMGRTDLLRQTISGNMRWDSLDLTELLLDFHQGKKKEHRVIPKPPHKASDKNEIILQAAKGVLEGKEKYVTIPMRLDNSDHAIGATLAGEIARRKLSTNDMKITIDAKGYAGHAFGFGAIDGMRLNLEGYANDSAGEAMGGNAEIVIVPPRVLDKTRIPHLIGNAAAYGATGGTTFVAGKAGQRFGVRNSGATLVCEGVGKYAFEYMTGGIGIVLGRCGPCIGSGMTGGELFIYDPTGESAKRLHEDVKAQNVDPESDREKTLTKILGDFFEQTKSPRAAEMSKNWPETRPHFIHVIPR